LSCPLFSTIDELARHVRAVVRRRLFDSVIEATRVNRRAHNGDARVAPEALGPRRAAGKATLGDMTEPIVIAERGHYFFGGQLVRTEAGTRMKGQTFVQYEFPIEISIHIRSS
jgi:hypothetical protein